MRNIITDAVILKKYRIGEIHKGLKIFTPSMGILNIIAYGAYRMRNRFRIVTEPFSYSKLYLYTNPINETYKLTDVEAKDLFEGIRGNINKFYTASLWSEIIMESKAGGGDFSKLFSLFVSALSILDKIGVDKPDWEDRVVLLSIQFLWRFLKIIGYALPLNICGRCGKEIGKSEEAFFSPINGEIVCSSCATENYYLLYRGARVYIDRVGNLGIGDSLKVSLERDSIESLKKFLYLRVQSLFDLSLKTLESGVNIL